MTFHTSPPQSLESLRPTVKDPVLDLVRRAGHDVSDWSASSSRGAAGARTNPKYCYEWAFIEPGAGIVLNLWHQALSVTPAGQIVHRENFRADADALALRSPGSPRARRARRLVEALETAVREKLTIRVILNDGRRRDLADPHSAASSVTKRQLDPEPWTIVSYDWATGEHVLRRGAVGPAVVDQFSITADLGGTARRREHSGFVYVREARVRQAVLDRSAGRCEHCGVSGFRCPDGSLYLETHHIVPLHEGGPDVAENMIALCPSHHREAHYGECAGELRSRFQDQIRSLVHVGA
ncbi:HNH endonuclease [Brevundimonas viscosa]|uniref:5-methylcytosine-specific restriction enzyme A n=1 Tax=Brevundimonas viscosa TaxID=871741 RepID=A0A1I6P3U2_9CAUL|nr:HNH endonuclease signature motif containing protein [Brevundimonas viscosa]SFS34862.1 5-methylcytosine-specific restriction enzyme A [Brevundimonas viscosa]